MTSREEFRKYRSAAHKQEINIHVGTYSDVPCACWTVCNIQTGPLTKRGR